MTTATPTPQELQALLNGPAGVPPSGTVPDFVNPSSLLYGVIVTLILTLSVSTIALATRIYTKLRLIKSLDIEDYVLTLSWASMISESVPATITTSYGAGKHIWDIRLKDFINQLYWVNAAGIGYCLSVVLIKLAILLQYRRIFVPNRQGSLPMYLTLYITMAIIVTFYIIAMIFNIVECTPREAIWNPFVQGASCFNRDGLFQATGVFNVVSDFTILIIPIPKIWQLQMTRSRKIAVTGLFATGLLACITSIMRTYYTSVLLTSPDVSWYVALVGCWTAAEMAAGILVCCLPVAPRFFSFLNPKIKSAFSSLRKTVSFSGGGSSRTKLGSHEINTLPKAKDSNELSSVETQTSAGGLPDDLKAEFDVDDGQAPLADEEQGISDWSGRTILDVGAAHAPQATKRDMFETKINDGF